jgi:hypothetical protein
MCVCACPQCMYVCTGGEIHTHACMNGLVYEGIQEHLYIRDLIVMNDRLATAHPRPVHRNQGCDM